MGRPLRRGAIYQILSREFFIVDILRQRRTLCTSTHNNHKGGSMSSKTILKFFSLTTLLAVLVMGGYGCSSSSSGGDGGGDGDGDGDGDGAESRELTGSIAAASISALVKNQSGDGASSCSDLTICCGAYDGSLAVAEVAADCSFTLSLPLDNFCYCSIFSGADEDGNECPDTYLASLGCSENGYSGAIPVYADDDGTTDAIDLGEGNFEGAKLVVSAAGNPCAQVDQDGDGSDDAGDDDDDGDDIGDGEDDFNLFGCENLDELDSDDNGTPDIYESFFSSDFAISRSGGLVKNQGEDSDFADFIGDDDDDGVPDGCDTDFGCEPDDGDVDGDCIPDDFDWCADDEDGDELYACFDCDDTDPDIEVSIACYDDFCASDSDGDGFGGCDDCDDENAEVQYECRPDEYCEIDEDGDGLGTCLDCDDGDATIDFECREDGTACEEDNDGDGIDVCRDCNDFDDTETLECFDDTDFCAEDNDADGVDYCQDCDDFDDTSTFECYDEGEEGSICDEDLDGDGVGFCEDCDDFDPSVGSEDCDDGEST